MYKYYKTVYETRVTGFFKKTFTEDGLPLGSYLMDPSIQEVEITKEEFDSAMGLLSINHDEFYDTYGTHIEIKKSSSNGSGGIGTSLI